MSLYSLTGDFFVPVGLDFNNSSSFTQQCVDCYHTAVQLGYHPAVCDNNRYTSTCPYLDNCQRSCFKNKLQLSLKPGDLYCGFKLPDILNTCQLECHAIPEPPQVLPDTGVSTTTINS